MVGDDLDADVAGALDFGMGAVLVGPLAEAGGGAAPSAPALWRARDLAEVGRLLAEPSRMAP